MSKGDGKGALKEERVYRYSPRPNKEYLIDCRQVLDSVQMILRNDYGHKISVSADTRLGFNETLFQVVPQAEELDRNVDFYGCPCRRTSMFGPFTMADAMNFAAELLVRGYENAVADMQAERKDALFIAGRLPTLTEPKNV